MMPMRLLAMREFTVYDLRFTREIFTVGENPSSPDPA
jgi:hypothetical protein